MLTSGVTNDPEARELRPINQYLDLAEYQDYFNTLPPQVLLSSSVSGFDRKLFVVRTKLLKKEGLKSLLRT